MHPRFLVPLRRLVFSVLAVVCLGLTGVSAQTPAPGFASYVLDYTTPTDAGLQKAVESIDARLRAGLDMKPEDTAVGVLDLRTLRLALVHPDQSFYAASVPKVGILLAYFQSHPEAATHLAPPTRETLGLMIKRSDNGAATSFSKELGLKNIQAVLDSYGFYDAHHGGGIWMGKHYGASTERYPDPVSDNSHAATVRQLVRYYLLLEQDKLVSPAASQTMREIFASPAIAPLDDKFVKGLAGRDVQVRRKSGTYEMWFHDTAIVTGGGRDYIVVALTHHAKGEEFLVEFAGAVDDLLAKK